MDDYSIIVFWGCIVPLGITLFLFCVAFGFSLYLRRKQSLTAIALPIILWLTLFLMAIFYYGENFTFAIEALSQSNRKEQIAIGQVSDVQATSGPPYFFDPVENTFKPVRIICVDGVTYYTINHSVKINDWVKIAWKSTGHVVNRIDIISKQEALQSLDSIIPNTEEIEPATDLRFRFVPFLLLICYIVPQHVFGWQIAIYLEKKDRAWKQGIVPRKFGILLFGFHVLFLLSVVVFWGILGWTGVILITTIIGIIWTTIFIDKRTTRIFLLENAIAIERIFRKRTYPFKEIKSVQWGKSSTKHNRTLVLTFQTGDRLILQQEEYVGLENMYCVLKKQIIEA